MTWVPIFEIASKDFDKDLRLLKDVFELFQNQIDFKEGYKFSSEAHLAMGWWFYTIYIKIGFIKELVRYNHNLNSRSKDEQVVLKIIEEYLKLHKSKARVKFHGNKPLFTRYWSWLMR